MRIVDREKEVADRETDRAKTFQNEFEKIEVELATAKKHCHMSDAQTHKLKNEADKIIADLQSDLRKEQRDRKAAVDRLAAYNEVIIF